jgi:hypothetical protein
MLFRIEILAGTFTVNAAIHGEKNNWTVSVSAPGNIGAENIESQSETQETSPWGLFDDMLADVVAALCRRHPERAPVHARPGVRR